MKKVALALSTAAVVASPIVAVVASPVQAYASSLPIHSLVRYGSRGSAVKVVQSSLNKLGFHSGPVDGIYGPETHGAVVRFQKAHHLVQDGIVGPHTWAALSSALGSGTTSSSPPKTTSRGSSLTGAVGSGSTSSSSTSSIKYPGTLVRYGSRGAEVKEVQTQLNKLGFHSGADDGIYGPETHGAVVRFQRAHHLTQDGIVGPQTWPILFPPQKVTTPPASPPPTTSATYTAYKADGTTQIGQYKTEADAQKAAASTPGAIVKDSSGKVVYQAPDYEAVDKSGKSLGDFISESTAQSKLSNTPGGKVLDKDSSNHVVYTEPDFGVYTTPVNMTGEYTSQSAANAKASSTQYVVDLNAKKVVKMPSNYYYLSSGYWTSKTEGFQGYEVPSFAKNGDNYLVVNKTPGQSPYEDQYYLLDDSNGNYLGTSQSWTWENSYRQVNLTLPSTATAAQIDTWLHANHSNSALYGLGSSFIGAQNYYGSNAVYLLSHAIIESAYGDSSIALNKNNLFGFGAYDANPGNDAGVFPTDNYSIYYQSWFVRNFYLNPNSSLYHKWPTLDGMNQHYATSTNWSSAIATVINEYTHQTSSSYSASSAKVIEPKSTMEPIYFTNGFTGTLNVPSFPGTLQNGSTGSNVKVLQNALDANGENLTIDGDYGPLTEGAVKDFQKNMGLSQTGIVDATTWQTLFPTVKGTVDVDEMMVGRMSGKVVEQYHITPDKSGSTFKSVWVYAPYVNLTNVSRIEPTAGPDGAQAQIAVYKSAGTALTDASSNPVYVHAGDYVVNSSSSTPGYTQVSFTNIENGNAVKYTGLVKTADVQFISYTAEKY